ncbi:HTH_Tnp_Tc3_2 domain-containing protein [Trichonephila clavipes]|nr:HTH_Tnp_Tc3_2 domain-containing protein [Trichonephila clavipes]
MPQKTCHVEKMMHIKSIVIQNPHVEVIGSVGERESKVLAQVSSLSLNRGSKFRWPSPIATEQVQKQTVDTRGTHARKSGSGATRKTTRREDRRIVRQALVDPTVTRSTIRADVGVAIVPQTISRLLAEANLKSKRPFRAFPLTPEHRQLRLQ